MAEPIGDKGLVDPETALRREAEVLAQRFPGVDPAEIDQRVHDTYDTLKEGASIESHLVAVTENVVTGELLSEGADLRSRTQDPE